MIRNVDKLLEILVQAADQTNCRLILQSNWSSFSKQTEHVVQNQTCSKTKACIPKHLFIKTAPHRLLFPWCDAVCHHGGAGKPFVQVQATKKKEKKIYRDHCGFQVQAMLDCQTANRQSWCRFSGTSFSGEIGLQSMDLVPNPCPFEPSLLQK